MKIFVRRISLIGCIFVLLVSFTPLSDESRWEGFPDISKLISI